MLPLLPAKTLGEGAIHIWEIELVHDLQIPDGRELLSLEENRRAERFHFDRDRSRFIAAHAAMRCILGRYLCVRPQNVALSRSRTGKPALAGPFEKSRITFNLSHSGDLGLLALTLDSLIGVDIERIREDYEIHDSADVFSTQEEKSLRSLPQSQRTAAFFSCWTRKEAYVKALGDGLSIPLRSLDVGFASSVPPAPPRVLKSPRQGTRWSMYDIPMPDGYCAALVVEGKEHRLQQLKWSRRFEATPR
jgi:4'-phosphopantetheinyl transferase